MGRMSHPVADRGPRANRVQLASSGAVPPRGSGPPVDVLLGDDLIDTGIAALPVVAGRLSRITGTPQFGLLLASGDPRPRVRTAAIRVVRGRERLPRAGRARRESPLDAARLSQCKEGGI